MQLAQCVSCSQVVRWKDVWGGELPTDPEDLTPLESAGWAICMTCVDSYADEQLELADGRLRQGTITHNKEYQQELDKAKTEEPDETDIPF